MGPTGAVTQKSESWPDELEEMSRRARKMLHGAIQSLADENATQAQQIMNSDLKVDAIHKDIFKWAKKEIPSNVDETPAIIDVLSIARKIERIADLATNIAEDVIFMVEGTLVRHSHIDAPNSS